MRRVVLALSLVFAVGSPSLSIADGAQDHTTIIGIAHAIIKTLVTEDFCAVMSRFDDNLKSRMTAEKLQEGWATIFAQAGKFKTVTGTEVVKTPEGNFLILVRFEYEKVVGTARIIFDAEDRVIGFWYARGGADATIEQQVQPPGGSGSADSESGVAAKRVVAMLEAEQFSEVWEMSNSQMKSNLSVEQIREIWARVNQNVGSFRRITDSQLVTGQGFIMWNMRCAFQRGFMLISVGFDNEKKIGALYFAPTL